MAYMLGQYNYMSGQDISFMTLLDGTYFSATRRPDDSEESSQGDSGETVFHDECLLYTDNHFFQTNHYYYFHGKIRRWTTSQTFYIKLVNYNDSGDEAVEQYIKSIVIGPSTNNEQDLWVNVEFTFAPVGDFDCLLFELVRTTSDWQNVTRSPKIIYEEVSEINNILTTQINASSLIKIGVQSRPGFLMCINGEEIHTNRTGIYELKNGIMIVNFFSAVTNINAGQSQSDIDAAIQDIDDRIAAIDFDKEPKDYEELSRQLAAIHSVAILTNKGSRDTSGFTLDYMYKTE